MNPHAKRIKLIKACFEAYLWLFIQRSFTKYNTSNNPIGIQTAHAIPAAVPGDILPLNYNFQYDTYLP